MSRVLLIAKSSEFENADYLDIRPLLADAGVDHYDLIETFDTATLRDRLPAATLVIVTSGVFGDAEFRRALNNELAPAWQSAVRGECSFLILSQLLLAASGEDLPAMPDDLRITPSVRPPDEPKAAGRLGPPLASAVHQASVLPVVVDYDALTARALASSLQGLYWHWWTPKHPELWRTIVTDQAQGGERPLVIEHVKNDGRSRIVLSAIALDRIRDPELLANLIQLCSGGEYNVGLIDGAAGSISSGMMVSSLRRAGERVFAYDAEDPEQVALAVASIGNGVHDSILISPSVPESVVRELEPHLQTACATGRLRLLQITDVSPAANAVHLTVTERGTTAEFDNTLARSRWQLSAGLIGQSIFDTAKVLKVVSEVDPGLFVTHDWSNLTAELTSRVRPDGTFESPAVPTSAFVYVAAVILQGSENKELRRALVKSLEWLLPTLAGETRSNVIRSAVYLTKARLLGAPIPADFFERLGGSARLAETARDDLNLLEIALDRDDGVAVNHHLGLVLVALDDPTVSAPGDRADLLMAFTRVHARDAGAANTADAQLVSSAITQLANEITTIARQGNHAGSFPTSARLAAALELYSRTVAVPTAAIVAMLSTAHTETQSRTRWDDAVTFATTARAAVTAAQGEQKKLRRSVATLRFQHRFSRLLILILAIVAVGASVLLFYAVEPDFGRLATVWGKFTANWGVLSGLITLTTTLVAWVLFSFRDRPKGADTE